MSIYYPAPSVSITIAANSSAGSVAGDVSAWTVQSDMTISIGSRNAVIGPKVRILNWTPTGSTGATFTLAEPYSTTTSYSAAAFVLDTQGFTGSATSLALAGLTRVISYLTRLLGADTNADSESKTVTLDRANNGVTTYGRQVWSIAGQAWFQAINKTVGSAQRWLLQASTDGASFVDALVVSQDGTVDFRSGSTDVASAATCDIGAAPTRRVNITGTTTITSFGSGGNKERRIVFAGALTLTHNATSLRLPANGANIVTAAGDTAEAVSDASGNWRVLRYSRANGKPVAANSASDVGLGATVTPTFGGMVLNSAGPFLTYQAATAPATLGTTVSIGGVNRWFQFFSDGTNESGGNVGSNYALLRYGDTGTFLSAAISITRSNGNTTFGGTVFTPTGTVTTSDARLKTEVQPFDAARIAAARDLAAAIGSFKFLASIAEKGEAVARTHTGLTVQRAIDILEGHGLDPFAEAFICYDAWEASPAIPPIEARPAVIDEDGTVLDLGEEGRAGVPERPAGNEYRFRTDQLALFIARGQEARLAALEAHCGV
ncbi:tail fiber domain-containing protein [uncultured Enterovirga sp.]|uniref:tail fiber domain-containing protein n=1 Tax=uncultured Enterovirga sp. TaxID=2026352 RepID=UPI0035CC1E40